MQFIKPDWPAPATVYALASTRAGGVSRPPYDSLNLGDHVGDDPVAVAANRQRLRAFLPAEPKWLKQVHGTTVAQADRLADSAEADAAVAFAPGTVCAVLTADCLPVLFCDRQGSRVAAAHAGWRGLAAGVLEASVAALQCASEDILAWLGPAIGPGAFEVGPEVRETFIKQNPEDAAAFTPHPSPLTPKHFMADIYALARLQLARAGVRAVYGGGLCTHTDAERFYSYRRDKATGRMATLIWLNGDRAA
jgi:hypothetical protein